MPGRGNGQSKGRERLRVWGPRACCAGRAVPHQGLGWAGRGHKTISWHVDDRQKNESGWRQAMETGKEKPRGERHNAEGWEKIRKGERNSQYGLFS